ncbi:MAG: hypothetical protein OMM_11010, partial [Candidatus Magnetoglobus multicellularis str. Araruama]
MTGQGSIQLTSDKLVQTVLPEWCGLFLADSYIQLKARPEINWNFISWSNDLTASSPEILYQITDNQTIQVNYQIKQVLLTLEGEKSMKVNHELRHLPITLPFDLYSTVLLEIVDSDDFICWAGDTNQNCSQSLSVLMSEDKTIAALYANPFEWRAAITGISESDGNTCSSQILVGTSVIENIQTEDKTDEYSCRMFIKIPEINDLNSVYLQKNDKRIYHWIIGINPHDSSTSLGKNTVNIQWDPRQFTSSGHYYMLNGYEMTAEIIISDMRQSTHLSVMGADATQYFSIIWGIG